MSDPLMLPVFPLKNAVLYPHTMAPLAAGRPLSVNAIEAAVQSEEKELAAFTQRDPKIDHPTPNDLYSFGTRAVIKRMMRGGDGIQVIVQGVERVELRRAISSEPFINAELEPKPLVRAEGPEIEALQRRLLDLGRRIQELAQPSVRIDFGSIPQRL